MRRLASKKTGDAMAILASAKLPSPFFVVPLGELAKSPYQARSNDELGRFGNWE
jgi:hypothetical protein